MIAECRVPSAEGLAYRGAPLLFEPSRVSTRLHSATGFCPLQ